MSYLNLKPIIFRSKGIFISDVISLTCKSASGAETIDTFKKGKMHVCTKKFFDDYSTKVDFEMNRMFINEEQIDLYALERGTDGNVQMEELDRELIEAQVINLACLSSSKPWRSNILDEYIMVNHAMGEKVPKITESLYEFMTDEDKMTYDEFPDIVTIYRGCHLAEGLFFPFRQSWTTDQKKAEFFAYKYFGNKRQIKDMVVKKTEVKKRDIYGYTSSRKEQEVILNTVNLTYENCEIISSSPSLTNEEYEEVEALEDEFGEETEESIKKHIEIVIAKMGVLNSTSSSGAEFNIADIAKEAGITSFEFEAPSNNRVGDAPLLDNGLNLLYAPQSFGKSYTSIGIAGESGLPAVFIDLESNGSMFVNHCKNNGVAYVYAGSSKDVISEVKKLVQALKNKLGKVLIIIDSYSDMFPDDEGKMAQQSQKQLGDLHKFFMREVELPILILDHATEQTHNGINTGFKIEGNKSGKFKKTVVVLRLETIGGNIENGTFVTVERSRNQDALPVGHTQQYRRNSYLQNKIQMLIDEKKLSEEFKTKDLESVLNGDDRELWRQQRDEIAISHKEQSKGRGKTADLWMLNKREME